MFERSNRSAASGVENRVRKKQIAGSFGGIAGSLTGARAETQPGPAKNPSAGRANAEMIVIIFNAIKITFRK